MFCRQVFRGDYAHATSATQQNEQSMVLKVVNLESGDARAAFKNVNMDKEKNYKKIEMYSHAEAITEYALEDDDLDFIYKDREVIMLVIIMISFH